MKVAEPFGAIFRKPFPQQVSAFRLRLGDLIPTAKWDDIQKSAHDRAFVVAGAMKADLLADLAEAVDRAIADGESLEQFRVRFRNIVKTRGWHGWTGEGTKRGEAWRTKVIYRTNMATSYAAGRRAQLIEGKFPFWVYRHGGSENPRLVHLSWNGLVLPVSHPFWQTHTPVNDWGCSCYILGARNRKAARRLGGDPDKPLPDNWQEIDPKTGEPVGIGKGWGYAPEWQGAGLGLRFLNELCALWRRGVNRYQRPMPTLFHTSHPGLAAALRAQPLWAQTSANLGQKSSATSNGVKGRFGGHFRAVQGFRYVE